jgi:toxin ParE1/3/4
MADIWRYTADRWGAEQADAYIGQIRTAIARALSHPQTGGPVAGLPAVYRKLRSGSHRIIYRLAGGDLIVVRVLHERQDVPDEIEDS